MGQTNVILVHIIFERSLEVDMTKIKVIEKLSCPNNVKDIRSFIGHVNFYYIFI
jgi:hypothetical protein